MTEAGKALVQKVMSQYTFEQLYQDIRQGLIARSDQFDGLNPQMVSGYRTGLNESTFAIFSVIDRLRSEGWAITRASDVCADATPAVDMHIPLTVEELQAIDSGEPIWIERKGRKSKWVILSYCTKYSLVARGSDIYPWDEYGSTWTAYRYKPAVQKEDIQPVSALPRPLTVEALQDMNGEIWICYPQETHGGLANGAIDCTRYTFKLANYGKTWIAYRNRPDAKEDV